MAFNCRNNRPLRLAGDCQGGTYASYCLEGVRDAGDFNGVPSIPDQQWWRAFAPHKKGLPSKTSSRFLLMSVSVLEELCALLDDTAELLELVGSGRGALLDFGVRSRLPRHCQEAAEKLRNSLEQIETMAFGEVATWVSAQDW